MARNSVLDLKKCIKFIIINQNQLLVMIYRRTDCRETNYFLGLQTAPAPGITRSTSSVDQILSGAIELPVNSPSKKHPKPSKTPIFQLSNFSNHHIFSNITHLFFIPTTNLYHHQPHHVPTRCSTRQSLRREPQEVGPGLQGLDQDYEGDH